MLKCDLGCLIQGSSNTHFIDQLRLQGKREWSSPDPLFVTWTFSILFDLWVAIFSALCSSAPQLLLKCYLGFCNRDKLFKQLRVGKVLGPGNCVHITDYFRLWLPFDCSLRVFDLLKPTFHIGVLEGNPRGNVMLLALFFWFWSDQ